MANSSNALKEGSPGIPPCQAACPIHQEVREYLRLIAIGDFNRSLEVIKRSNPLSSVCGTICAHHCEDECRRQNVDEPLSIRGLKRAAVEFGRADFAAPANVDADKKVAVIGSGPAGLIAAFDLALQGCPVTVFEREKMLGGAPRNFIPLYRLPDETVDLDIENLKKLGIEFKAGVEFGTDFGLEELKNEGFKAVLIAVGLTASRGLPIPGADHRDVLLALEFLKASKRENFRLDGREVIVIGGGNVAMDVARSAVRCGAAKVRLACLESEEEMPAFTWEIEEAKEEGVEFNCSWGPKAIKVENGVITGLELKECTSVFDEQKRFNPTYNEDNVKTIPGNTVIFAIGQGSDLEAVKKAGVPVDERGRLVFDPATMKTPLEGVFACGEIVAGPSTAVKAMANGRVAAMAVYNHLSGKPFVASMVEEEMPLPELASDVAQNVPKIARHEIPMLNAEERSSNFQPVEKGYTLAMAVWESRRCLGCAAGAQRIVEKCADCLTCLRTCPYNVPVVSEQGDLMIRDHQCQACGLCLTVCPNLAIEFRAPYIAEAEAQLEPAVRKLTASRNGSPGVLILACGLGAYALPGFNEGFLKNKGKNVEVVKFPCISKIDTTHILKAFQLGADAVVIAGCAEEDTNRCPFQKTLYWAEQRVSRVKSILKDVGIEEERLTLCSFAPEAVDNFGEAAGEVLAKINELGKR
jgi:NADPH-dependent glutamate synthase beta subunit-like oxidoreductase/coenzyme F420-reducing hydrogenase delta subunit/NAD-dependent dihydropyrimidine dehydrogenase PreA subunit